MNLNKQSWKMALYFVGFETLYWLKGKSVIYAIEYMIFDGDPLIATMEESGVFHSWTEFMISFIILCLSIWCFKQFVFLIIEELKCKH